MPMPRASLFVAAAVAAGVLIPVARAEVPRVAVSIAPLQSLAATVMQGVGTPDLLLPPGASPHDYALKPSDAQTLDQADVVFWVGPTLEGFLMRPLAALADQARTTPLLQTPGLTLLPVRAGGAWEAHAHHDEGEDHDDHRGEEHDHVQDDHAAVGTDAHVWLDPRNGAVIVGAMAATLAAADPEHAAIYHANAEAAAGELSALERELAVRLAPVAGVPYVVFHDAYQYFEHRFAVSAIGSVTVEPGRPVGARRVAELREKISALHAACIFAEPQFEPRLIAAVGEGTGARTGVLDPIGGGAPGVGQYSRMLRTMADALVACLDGKG